MPCIWVVARLYEARRHTVSATADLTEPDSGWSCEEERLRGTVMFRQRALLLLGTVCWTGALVSGLPKVCRLDHPGQLKLCVQDVLNLYRPQLVAQLDPLRLADNAGSSGKNSWWLSNIRVDGASDIQIKHLYVRPIDYKTATVLVSVYWPHLRANMDVKVKLCKKILWKTRCVTVRASPKISVTDATASLTTRWSSAIEHGRLVIIPTDTKLTIWLRKIHFEPKFKGLTGFVYKAFGGIAKRFVRHTVLKEWDRQRPRVEKELARDIEKLVNERGGPAISKLLTGGIPH